MELRSLIQWLLDADLICGDLAEFPAQPAPVAELKQAEDRFGPLDLGLLRFYSIWDGADLDVVRVLSPKHLRRDELGLVFGSDPSGFVYRFGVGGHVNQEDADGGSIETVAKDFNDFLFGYVFGARAAAFGGEEWLKVLRGAGLVA